MTVRQARLRLKQRVAIKLTLPEMTAFGEVVPREARAAVKLRSEHVARVVDVGKLDTGEPCMVMEMLRGSRPRLLGDERRVVRGH